MSPVPAPCSVDYPDGRLLLEPGRGGPDDSTARAACVLHPFSFPRIPRGAQGRTYIADHYEDFATITRRGLDALIMTGANIATAELEKQPFWQSLLDVMAWAESNVRSTLCSCLATHAVSRRRLLLQRRRATSGECAVVFCFSLHWAQRLLEWR